MRRTLLTLLSFMLTLTIGAVPALRKWRTITQPDGTQIKLMLVGDERLHYFVTEDEVPVMEQNGAFCYADGVGFGMRSTGVVAHESAQRTAYESDLARVVSTKRIEETRPMMQAPMRKAARRAASDGVTSSDRRVYKGDFKTLVILVNFSDVSFKSDHDINFFNRMINEEGYTNSYGAIGSLRDYFLKQSNNQLKIHFDIEGPYTLSHNMSYYGSNDMYGNDVRSFHMVAEAVRLARAGNPDLNFADYDWDGDGDVDQVYVIYAGYGEATGGSGNTIWPASSNFDDWNTYAHQTGDSVFNLKFDGKRINTFAYGNELNGSYGSKPMGIGTMAHEFSHCLGYPDLYDINYGGKFGMGSWDILSGGSYGGPDNNAWVPVGYSSYERWAAGWIDYKELTGYNDTITGQKSQADHGDTYVIYNDSVRNLKNPDKSEYILLENRTQKDFDTYLPASGLLAIHVNYVKSIWDENMPNSSGNSNGKQNVTIFPADNRLSSETQTTDPFPYGKKDSLTDKSSPSMTWYNPGPDKTKLAHKPVVQIKYDQTNHTTSFIFNPRDTLLLDAPTISGTNYFKDSTLVELTAPKGDIFYSKDNKTFHQYAAPFYVKDSCVVYAYADGEGWHRSSTTSKKFYKQVKLVAPSIKGDTLFDASTTVTITSPRGTNQYSVNGSAFKRYTGSFTVTDDSTLVRAFSTSSNKGYLNSDTVEVLFLKKPSPDAIGSVLVDASKLQGRISVYTLNGKFVCLTKKVGNLRLPEGVYLLRDENGNAAKYVAK